MPEAGQVRRHLRAGPSDHPDLAQWLVEQGIESMSLNPDTVVETWLGAGGRDAAASSRFSIAASSVRMISRRGHWACNARHALAAFRARRARAFPYRGSGHRCRRAWHAGDRVPVAADAWQQALAVFAVLAWAA
jgi:hypothetical protein